MQHLSSYSPLSCWMQEWQPEMWLRLWSPWPQLPEESLPTQVTHQCGTPCWTVLVMSWTNQPTWSKKPKGPSPGPEMQKVSRDWPRSDAHCLNLAGKINFLYLKGQTSAPLQHQNCVIHDNNSNPNPNRKWRLRACFTFGRILNWSH